MNVLLVVTGLANDQNPSGSSYNNRFAIALKNKGLNVTIIHLRAMSPKRPPILVRKNEDNIDVIELSCFLLYSFKKMPRFLSFVLAFQIRRLKNKYLADLDVIHAISGGAVAPSYILSKYLTVPMISQFIGSDVAIQADYYKSLSLFNKGLSLSKVLCFNSWGLKRDFEAHFDIEKNKKVIYRGISLKEFPYCLDLNKDRIVILFLGGFPVGSPNLKGGLTLLDAISILDKTNLDRQIVIRIGGPNSLQKVHSDRIANKLKNESILVNFIGSVQRKDVIKELSDSQIVLIPSLSEGIPNVLYEAMAAGNGIIASNVGGIPEFLDNNTGMLIPSDDSSALANAIATLVNDCEKLKLLAINARDKIEHHDYNNFINDYISLYNI